MSVSVHFSGWQILKPEEFAVADDGSDADVIVGPWMLDGVSVTSEPCMQWLLRETGQAEPLSADATGYVLKDDVKRRWRTELDTWGKVCTGSVVYSREGPAVLRGLAPVVEVACPVLGRALRLADRRGEHVHLLMVAAQEKEQPELDGVLADTDTYRTCSAAMAGPGGWTVDDVSMPQELLYLYFLAPFTPESRVKYADGHFHGIYLSIPVLEGLAVLRRGLEAGGQLHAGPLAYTAPGVLVLA
jgi:hypothetical protein